jgi:Spy/CpxP family protein refolding chaperone
MKTRNLVLTLVVIGLVVAPAVVVAQGFFEGHGGKGWGRGGHGHGHGGHGGPGGGLGFLRMLPRLAEKLDLSEAQQAEIESIVDQSLPAIRELRVQMREARQEFRDSQEPGQFDEAAVRAFAESQAQLMTEMMVSTARLKADVFGVLTPEQVEQLEELRGKFRECRELRGGGKGR